MDDGKWIPRENYSLTLNEVQFLFTEYLANISSTQPEAKREKEDILELRKWITEAAIFGKRL